MSDKWVAAKQKILHHLHQEAIVQLDACRKENLELFTNSVENCNQLIADLERLDKQAPSLSEEQVGRLRLVGKELLDVREQTAALLPAWREKLRQAMLREQAHSRFKHAYEEEDEYVPAVFFDKRK